MSDTLRRFAKSTLGLVLGTVLLFPGQVASAQPLASEQISGPTRVATLLEDVTAPATDAAVPVKPSDDPGSEPVDPPPSTNTPSPTESRDLAQVPPSTRIEDPTPDSTEPTDLPAPNTVDTDSDKNPDFQFSPPDNSVAAKVSGVPGAKTSAFGAASSLSQGFQPGYIISDTNFYDSRAMSAAQIHTFLNQRIAATADGRCTIGEVRGSEDRRAGSRFGSTTVAYACLKDAKFSTKSRASNAYCSAYAGSSTPESTATIISKVARSCGINPRVLLVILQKEQSLITDTWPTAYQFDYATGANCPDNGPGNSANCDAGSAGFPAQVYFSAWHLKRYTAQNGLNYNPGRVNTINWHHIAARGCGTSEVYINNLATATLYTYTPYRPNQAALNAGWGEGDSCSSYGNRNFFQYYKQWFGSPNSYFSDVPQNHKYFTAIEWMAEAGISKGTATSRGTVYQPSNGTTRRAMAAFLYRLNGSPQVTLPKASPFSDVKPGDSFYKEIVWMHQQGLANGFKKAGSKPEYRPISLTSRGAMAAFIFRMTPSSSNYQAPATSRFGDIPQSHQFYREISWMRDAGLSSGYTDASGKRVYKAGATVTRQAMAAFLYRLEH